MPEEIKSEAKPLVKERAKKAREVQSANAAGGQWVLVLQDGHTVEDTLQPSYWANVARLFNGKYENFIKVVNVQRTIRYDLYVRAVQENQLIVSLDGEVRRFGPKSVVTDNKLRPKWNVGKRGWDVVNEAGQVVQDGSKFGVEEQAQAWISDHLKKLAA